MQIRTVRIYRIRRKTGNIASFAAELAIGSALIIALVLSMINIVIVGYYKEKLAFITTEAGVFAAALAPTGQVQPATQQYVLQLISAMGLQASNIQVMTGNTTIGSANAVKCLVSASFPLLQGSALAPTINLSDIAIETKAFAAPIVGAPSTAPTIIGNYNIVNANANPNGNTNSSPNGG